MVLLYCSESMNFPTVTTNYHQYIVTTHYCQEVFLCFHVIFFLPGSKDLLNSVAFHSRYWQMQLILVDPQSLNFALEQTNLLLKLLLILPIISTYQLTTLLEIPIIRNEIKYTIATKKRTQIRILFSRLQFHFTISELSWLFHFCGHHGYIRRERPPQFPFQAISQGYTLQSLLASFDFE